MTVRGVTGMQRVKWDTNPTRCHMMAQLESSLGRLSNWRTGFWDSGVLCNVGELLAGLVELLSDGRKARLCCNAVSLVSALASPSLRGTFAGKFAPGVGDWLWLWL